MSKKKKILTPLQVLREQRRGKAEVRQFKRETAPQAIKSLRQAGTNLRQGFSKLNTQKLERGIASAFTFRSAGRPQGRFKRGLPAQQIRDMNNNRARVMQQIQQREMLRLQEKGYTYDDIPKAGVMREKEIVANLPVSANTLSILDKIKRIHAKGRIDNLEMQRRLKERRMLSEQMNLLKTPSIFGPESNTFDIFDDTHNPLKAQNIFKEDPNAPRILNTRRPSLLNTDATGNTLHF